MKRLRTGVSLKPITPVSKDNDKKKKQSTHEGRLKGMYSFGLSLHFLMEKIGFKNNPVFGIFMRICNLAGIVRVFLHKEITIYYKKI